MKIYSEIQRKMQNRPIALDTLTTNKRGDGGSWRPGEMGMYLANWGSLLKGWAWVVWSGISQEAMKQIKNMVLRKMKLTG